MHLLLVRRTFIQICQTIADQNLSRVYLTSCLRIIALLLSVCLSLTLCGCGSSHSSNAPNTPQVAFALSANLSAATFAPNSSVSSDLYGVAVDTENKSERLVRISDYGRGTPVTLADLTALNGTGLTLSFSSGLNLLYLVSNPQDGNSGTAFVYTTSGQLVRSFAVQIAGNYSPNSAAVDSQGNLYVVYVGFVNKYDINGKPVNTLPRSYAAPPEPTIAVDSQDRVYVPDNGVSVFAPDGILLSTIKLEGGVGEIHSFVIDKNDNLYATSYNDFKLHVWDKQGNKLFESTDTVIELLSVDDQLRIYNSSSAYKTLVSP